MYGEYLGANLVAQGLQHKNRIFADARLVHQHTLGFVDGDEMRIFEQDIELHECFLKDSLFLPTAKYCAENGKLQQNKTAVDQAEIPGFEREHIANQGAHEPKCTD